MSRRIETRSFEECEKIVRLWLEGSREEAIEILGAEPTDDFLSSFKPSIPVSVVPETPVRRKNRGAQDR
jgi:hypothetical protein